MAATLPPSMAEGRILSPRCALIRDIWESMESCRLEQFHLRARNWYWHSSMALTAPSRTESMNPGFRLQNFTCFLMSEPFIWSQSWGSLLLLARLDTWLTASHLMAATLTRPSTARVRMILAVPPMLLPLTLLLRHFTPGGSSS